MVKMNELEQKFFRVSKGPSIIDVTPLRRDLPKGDLTP